MWQRIQRIANHKTLAVGVLFVVALTFRMGLVHFVHDDLATSDGIQYLRLATNLANARGYTDESQSPHQPHFFREPGYPVFLASVIKLYALYYPSAIPCTFLLREVLQTTFVLGLGYCFARFLLDPGKGWIAATGVLLGFAILTLKSMVVLGLFIFIFARVRLGSLQRAVGYSAVCAVLAIAVPSPWVYSGRL